MLRKSPSSMEAAQPLLDSFKDLVSSRLSQVKVKNGREDQYSERISTITRLANNVLGNELEALLSRCDADTLAWFSENLALFFEDSELDTSSNGVVKSPAFSAPAEWTPMHYALLAQIMKMEELKAFIELHSRERDFYSDILVEERDVLSKLMGAMTLRDAFTRASLTGELRPPHEKHDYEKDKSTLRDYYIDRFENEGGETLRLVTENPEGLGSRDRHNARQAKRELLSHDYDWISFLRQVSAQVARYESVRRDNDLEHLYGGDAYLGKYKVVSADLNAHSLNGGRVYYYETGSKRGMKIDDVEVQTTDPTVVGKVHVATRVAILAGLSDRETLAFLYEESSNDEVDLTHDPLAEERVFVRADKNAAREKAKATLLELGIVLS